MADYDKDTHAPGRCKEVDEIAHSAARAVESDPAFKTNESDPANDNKEPQGNK